MIFRRPMANWAELDDNNIVLRVVVTSNSDEDEGYQWLVDNLGGRWMKTSWNTFANQHDAGGIPFRGNFASIGYIYDEELDVFYPPKPFDSWILDMNTYQWIAPVPYPEDQSLYVWNESKKVWDTFVD